VTAEERILKMLQGNEIRDPMEAPEMPMAIAEAAGAVNIEEVLRRAREIHRQHGGIFGYDFEDWAQAWSDRPAGNGDTKFEAIEEAAPAMVAHDTEEVCESCFRYDN
jgi:hypothetical protein